MNKYLLGTDVSRWQKKINWKLVKKTDFSEFTYIRLADGINKDACFDQNWQDAKNEYIPRGFYLYFRPTITIEKQLDLIEETIKGDIGELKPALDLEAVDGLAPDKLFTVFCDAIQKMEARLKVTPIVYTSKNFWLSSVVPIRSKNYDYTWLRKYKLWVAHYNAFIDTPLAPNDYFDWGIWQYSNKGTVDGINGNVDLNRMKLEMQKDFFIKPAGNTSSDLENRVTTIENVLKEKGWL